MPTETVKKEKKNFKEEFLQMIATKYGVMNSMVMEKALKTQDKQIEQAMMEGGMTAEQIGESKGIQIKQKSASSPFGFGGASMQDGQITEQQPGLLAGLLSTLVTGNPKTSASMDMQKLLQASQIQENQLAGPSKQANLDLANQRLALSQERLALEQGMEERRIGAEKRRVLEDTKNTIYNSGAELTTEDLQDPDIAKIVMPLIKQNNIEPIIDPDSGITIYSIPPKGVLEKVRKEVAAVNLKRRELAKELSDYYAVGDSLPTAEGLGRFEAGAKLFAGSIFQTDKQGAMAAQLNGLNKRLRVKLVRAAGDVGNLNIVEQAAAERLLYNFSDSTSLRSLKKAFLMDLTKALDDNSPMEIKKLVNKWMKQENSTTAQPTKSSFKVIGVR